MQALTEALMSGHLGGAGLDVHWVVSISTQVRIHVQDAANLFGTAAPYVLPFWNSTCAGCMHTTVSRNAYHMYCAVCTLQL